jgi:hypothetical protein
MKELSAEFFVGGTKLMQSIFTHFNERNSDSYLPYIKDIELMLRYLDEQKEQAIGSYNRNTAGELTPGGSDDAGGDAEFGPMAGTSAGSPPASTSERVQELDAEA